jgi:hypothetical protein
MKFIKLFEYYSHTLDNVINMSDEDIKTLICNTLNDSNDGEYERELSENELFHYIKNRIDIFKKLPDSIILYRVLHLLNYEDLNLNDIGKFYNLDWKNFDFDYFDKINMWYYDLDQIYIAEVKIPKSWIDFETTITQNILFPSEEEISIRTIVNKKNLISILPYLDYFPEASIQF